MSRPICGPDAYFGYTAAPGDNCGVRALAGRPFFSLPATSDRHHSADLGAVVKHKSSVDSRSGVVERGRSHSENDGRHALGGLVEDWSVLL